jgi:hypothetical protein
VTPEVFGSYPAQVPGPPEDILAAIRARRPGVGGGAMSFRLPRGGRLIDRTRPLGFTFDGRRLSGSAGDTLASAPLGAGETLVGRSFKDHRPRGIVVAGPEEPNALLALGTGGRFEPNARAATVELREGLEAASQNCWPSLAFDLGQTAGLFSRLLPAGSTPRPSSTPARPGSTCSSR